MAGSGRQAKAYPGPMAYAGIGMLNAICLLGGGALGWLVDRATGTLPLFLLVGLLLGAVVGVLGTRAELRRYGRGVGGG
ncbi:MAG TPA: AtpZ/AtpI family protein [Acidimicrobiales bacterium]|nr:AtpZ/AtpI family protein [Acidimicrobiales bacterium]